MQKIIDLMIGFILTLGLTSATFEFYHMIKRETLTKVSNGSVKLSGFTQKVTGQKNAW